MSFNLKYNQIKKNYDNEIFDIENIMFSMLDNEDSFFIQVRNFLKLPSKRIRILLPILYLKAIDGEITEEQKTLLAIVELVHNASLIHDDIIDESDTRRGQKNLSSKFGNKVAVILGDYILSLVLKSLVKLNNMQIIERFAQTINQMCSGEIEQQKYIGEIPAIENYLQKTRSKTAILFETAIVSTLLLSDKTYDMTLVSDFAINFGIAFQIRDDLYNFIDNDNKTNDFNQGIYTAPVIYGTSEDEYKSGIEKTITLLNNYVDNALKIVDLMPKNNSSNNMREVVELLRYDR